MSYRQATAVTDLGDGLWETHFAADWDILGNTNGGYMMAIASRAASEASGGRDPVSVTGHFTKPGRAGPAMARTEVVRAGRRFSVVRTTLVQDDAVVLETLGSYAEPREDEPEVLLSDARPEKLPPPDDSLEVVPAADAPFPPPFFAQVDARVDPRIAGLMSGEPMGEPVMLGWLRPKDAQPLDPHFLIMAADAFPPTTFNAGLPIGWTPTVELTVHVRFPRTQGWIRCELRSRFISGGFIEEDGRLWDESDRLVAQSRQLALVSTG